MGFRKKAGGSMRPVANAAKIWTLLTGLFGVVSATAHPFIQWSGIGIKEV